MTTLATYLSLISESGLPSLNILTLCFVGSERPMTLDVGEQIYEPLHLLLHRRCRDSELSKLGPYNEIKYVDVWYEKLVRPVRQSALHGSREEKIMSIYVGLSHFGIASYVRRDGEIIQRMRYQKAYIYAKQVKSYPALY
jgi:hypothetical protein